MDFKTKGNNLYSSGLKERAIEAYTTGINFIEEGGSALSEEDKKCLPMLYSNRSKVDLELCLADEALVDAELAIEANPQYAKAYLRRAEALVNLFKNKDALADLDTAEELEPGLAPNGCELRLRAMGEKWVPNCYLKRQLELRKKHKCDYVVLLTLDGEEIVEPVVLRTGALEPLFDKLLSGDSKPGYTILHLPVEIAGRVSTDTASKIEKLALQDLVADQFKKELGPDTALFNPSARSELNYYVFPADTQYKTRLRSGCDSSCVLPCLFPGSPRWIYDAKIRAILIEAINSLFEDPHSHKYDREIYAQMNAKPQQRAEDFFEECRQYHLKRDSNVSEAVCHGCGNRISDSDPQECLCRERFCRFSCYYKHHTQHQTECTEKVCLQPDRGLITTLYWGLALKGYFPVRDEPDLVVAWKERRAAQSEDPREAFIAEVEFYETHDSQLLRSEMESLPPGPTEIADFFLKWTKKMSYPLPTDSCARMIVKFQMCAEIRAHSVAQRPSTTDKLPFLRLPPPEERCAENFHRAAEKRGCVDGNFRDEYGFPVLMKILDEKRQT